MSSKKTVEQDLTEGLNEVLAHKHGKKILTSRRRELPKPAPEWSAKAIRTFAKIYSR